MRSDPCGVVFADMGHRSFLFLVENFYRGSELKSTCRLQTDLMTSFTINNYKVPLFTINKCKCPPFVVINLADFTTKI